MQITMDLNDDQIAILERAWPHFETREELAQAWLPLAVGAWLSWLSGEKRYNSLTEQYTDWIEKIYECVLPQTEAPSAEQLFNSFNVPYGQAQYIARVLNNRATARWREHALEELKARLREQKDEVYSWAVQDDAINVVKMMLSKPAKTELEIIIDDLCRQSPGKVDILRSSGRNFVEIKITARTFKKVCERLAI